MRHLFNRLASSTRKKARVVLPALIIAGTAMLSANAGAAQENPAAANDNTYIVEQIPGRVLAVDENAAENCASIDGGGMNADVTRRIRAIHDTLTQSETGSWITDFARDNTMGMVWMCLSSEVQHYGMYMSGRGVIKLPEGSTHDELVGTTAHELRHRWQEEQGYGSYQNQHLSEHSDRILEMASEADAEAFAVSVLWELKEKGNAAPFDAHNSVQRCEERNAGLKDGKRPCYFDISDSYREEVEANPDAIESGAALRAAFSQWYEDETRVNAYEFKLAMKHIGKNGPRRGSIKSRKEAQDKPGPDFTPPVESPVSKFVKPGEVDGMGELPHKGRNYLKQGGGYEKVMKGKRSLLPYIS